MNMFNQILKYLGILLIILLSVTLIYFIIRTIINIVQGRKKGYSIKLSIREGKYIKPINFIKWIVIDIFRGKDKLRLYGIWAFTGYYGQGKTLGCVAYAKSLQKEYPHRNIKIYSNIYIEGQEGRLSSWEDILKLPPNSIVIYDESQSDWSCNIGTSSFPEDFLRRITMCRKKQLAMFMTSPRYNRMNINIRESVHFVVECKNLMDMDRWFFYKFWHSEDYELYKESPIKLRMHQLFSQSIIATDDVYKMYDTNEIVESIKQEEVEIKKKSDILVVSDMMKQIKNDMRREIDELRQRINKYLLQ